MLYKVWVQIEGLSEDKRRIKDTFPACEPVDLTVCRTYKQAELILTKICDDIVDEQTKANWKKKGIFPYAKR